MNWITDLFSTIDNLDAEAFSNYLTDNARFKFGNTDAVTGKNNIKEAVAGFFSAIKAIEHSIENNWAINEYIFIQGLVTYTRHNDTTLSVPFANIFKMEGSKVINYQIYADTSELFIS